MFKTSAKDVLEMLTLISNTQSLFCKQAVKASQLPSQNLLSCTHQITGVDKAPNDTVLIHHKAQWRQVEGYIVCLKHPPVILKV